MRIINIIRLNILIEHLHSRLLIVGNQAGGKSDLFQSPEQFSWLSHPQALPWGTSVLSISKNNAPGILLHITFQMG